MNIQGFIGHEIVMMIAAVGPRTLPITARGILVGYDSNHLYICKYQELCHYQPQESAGGEPIFYKHRSAEAKVVNSDHVIMFHLATEEDWYEKHKLDNPLLLDKWLEENRQKDREKEKRGFNPDRATHGQAKEIIFTILTIISFFAIAAFAAMI